MQSIICGSALKLPLDDETVQCVVTSPPYWGLRDYGVDGQLGLEKTPEEYVAKMVEVFREVRRVLRKDGTLWLNIGDSYAAATNGSPHSGLKALSDRTSPRKNPRANHAYQDHGEMFVAKNVPRGLKPKDLCGIPWMLAFALRADGWWLRQDIIWAKPNPMPESVRDRCTRAHEYIFLLTKSASYFYDNLAIAEPLVRPEEANRKTPAKFGGADKWVEAQRHSRLHSGNEYTGTPTGTRNRRSVWHITPQPYRGAHFATFPEKLVEPCILAGSKEDSLVLDPFCGSGTVGVVCKRLQRRFVGLELNPAYCEMARQRIDVQEEAIAAAHV